MIECGAGAKEGAEALAPRQVESRLSCFTNCITLAKLLNLCASVSHQLNRERIIPHRVDGESEQTQMMNIELLVLSLQLCLLLNEN